MCEVSLVNKQANESFLLKKKQIVEACKNELREEIKKVNEDIIRYHNSEESKRHQIYLFQDEFRQTGVKLQALAKAILEQERCNLVFPFGKYKGLVVDCAIEKDKKYCVWFLYNVKGETFEALKVLDYLNKRLNKHDYWLSDTNKVIDKMLVDILPADWIDLLDKEQLIRLKNKFSTYQIEVERNDCPVDLGKGENGSNEFEYYGDSILGYEDFC